MRIWVKFYKLNQFSLPPPTPCTEFSINNAPSSSSIFSEPKVFKRNEFRVCVLFLFVCVYMHVWEYIISVCVFLCIYARACEWAQMYHVCRCVYICVHVEVRTTAGGIISQVPTGFLKMIHFILFWDGVSYWPGTHQGWLPHRPKDQPVSASTVSGLCVHSPRVLAPVFVHFKTKDYCVSDPVSAMSCQWDWHCTRVPQCRVLDAEQTSF